MSKRVWGSVSLTSLFITAGAGWYMYTQMARWMPTETGAPAPVKMSEPIPVPPPSEPTQPLVPPTETKPATEPSADTAANAEESKKSVTRNILFQIPKPNASSVYVTGEFNGWKRQSMRKNGKKWEISVSMKPGTYKYMFVVNDKRIRDPNNKNVKDGQSVIVVKPLQPAK